MTKKRLGIVGFGDFAQLMVKQLSPYFDICVSSRRPMTNKRALEFEAADIKTVLAQPYIIPSMPSQFLESFFTDNRRHINPEALVIDVCSVKVKPVAVLKRTLPRSVQILATHPLFGPASAGNGLKGQKIMLHPVRLPRDRYQKIKQFLQQDLGLHTVEASPQEHDRLMAYAQGLSHYIGRILQEMDAPESPLTTKAYDDLLDMKRIQGGDSLELFRSIMFENPYALEVNKTFKATLASLDEQLGIK